MTTRQLEKLVRLRRPREEIAQPVTLRLEALTDDPYRRTNWAHSAASWNMRWSTYEQAATGKSYVHRIGRS